MGNGEDSLEPVLSDLRNLSLGEVRGATGATKYFKCMSAKQRFALKTVFGARGE